MEDLNKIKLNKIKLIIKTYLFYKIIKFKFLFKNYLLKIKNLLIYNFK